MTKWTAPDIASIRGDNSRPLQKIFGSLTEYLKNTLNQTTEVSQTYVRNGEATALTVGTVVYLDAQQGDRATVKRAFNTSDATSAKTLGVVAENIPVNSNGLVTTLGYLEKVNTSAFTAGQTLYLGSTAGTFTATKPYAPNHLVYVGIVVRANAGNGIIYVRCQNGYELDEIHDVLITSPTAGQTLSYDAVNSLWKNATFSDGGGLTNLNASNLASGTVPTGRMTGAYTGITGVGTLAAGSIPTTLLTGTTLPASIVSSSLTSVGNITSGTWSGSFGAVSGANLTTLNASNLSSGTVASARISGSYTGITGVGTLAAGSIPASLLTGTIDSARIAGAYTGFTSITVDGASSAAFTLGDWTPNGNYGGVVGNKGYLLIGNNSGDDAMYLRTSTAGVVNIGANGSNTLAVGNGTSNFAGEIFATSNIRISTAGANFVAQSPSTGAGFAAQWVSVFGLYILFRNTSTRNDKENIQPLNGIVTANMIDDIEVSLWNRKGATGFPEIGPMAEDMDEVSPFLSIRGMDCDEEGNIVATAPSGINQNSWLSLLTLSIQDLRKRVEELEK